MRGLWLAVVCLAAVAQDLDTAVIDKFILSKDLFKQIETSIQHGLRVGDGFLRFRILSDLPEETKRRILPLRCNLTRRPPGSPPRSVSV